METYIPSLRKWIFILLLLSTSTIHAQSIKGKWYGVLRRPQNEFRLNLTVDSTEKGYQATFYSPDQESINLQLTDFSFNFPEIKLGHKYARITYDGLVDAGFKHMNGFFEQNNKQTKLNFSRDSIPPDESSTVSIRKRYIKSEAYITMRDGIKLFTSIYTPRDTTKTYPVIITRTPYGIEPDGKDEFNSSMNIYFRFVKENYILVFQDVRGTFMSEGEFEDIRPFIAGKKKDKDVDEATDTYDAVDWIIKNVKRNNGNVGVMGVSYPGFYATLSILSAHPAIKAVSPQAPVTSWFLGDDFHHNGAFFLMDCFSFYSSLGRPRIGPSRQWPNGFSWNAQDSYKFFLDQGSLSNLKKKYFGDTVKFWNQVFSHPNYDDYWKTRDPRQYLKNIRPAVMTVGGWFDAEDLFGALHTYSAIESQNPEIHSNYLVVGPWSHGQWVTRTAENVGNIYWGQDANKPYQEMEINFFDHYLQNKGKEDFAKATIFVTGANQWKTFNSWPPKNCTKQTLYLRENGKLGFSASEKQESFDEYLSDPAKPVPYSEKIQQQSAEEYMTDDQRFAIRRPDVVAYQSEKLNENITLTGPLSADLFVSTSGTDADYIVKLIDVFPDDTVAPPEQTLEKPLGGYQMLIRADVFRGRYRNGFDKPEAFISGKITEIKFELPDVAHRFKKGHRIMVQIQNSWFPLVDRNPQKFVDIYNCTETDFQKATQRIYHDKTHTSCIVGTLLTE